MANQNIRLRKKNGNAWDVLYPESLASLIKTQTGSNVQSFIDTVYDKIATPTANGVMSKEDKAKLNGIETGANKYVHPNNESTRHVTDVQISSWNDKYTRVEIDNKFNELNIGLDWKESVNTFNDLASTYPNAQDGWTVNVKDTDITYRYTGSAWIAISANSIPLASQSVDGKMSKADKKILDNLKPKVDSLATDLVSISQGFSGDITAVVGRINAVENTVNSHTTSISNLNSNKADKNHNHNSSYAAIDHSHSNYASSGHNHNSSYLSINGGTVNGAIAVKMSSPNVFFQNASGTLVGKIRSNDSGSLVISAGTDKTIYLRPTGDTSTAGQLVIGESSLTYNGKSISLDGHGNHVPATQSANNAVYLRNDNTWQTITPEKIGAAAASHTHNYFSSTGGDIKGDVFFRDDYTINWTRNTDYAAIGFKNTADNDTDSYMYFRTGDNGNEYFKFQHKTSSGETEWMSIKGDGVRIKGNLVYHQGNKPPASDIIQSSTHRFVSDTEKNTWNAKASTAVATTSANGLMTSAMVTKLNGIATNANNYVHPNDANTRHVTDSEKSNWNSKAAGNHNHTSLTGITSLSFAAQSSDSASIRTAIDGVNTYFDFMLSDDPGENDQWRWIFTPSGATAFNAMVLNPISATKAELRVNGDIYANGNKVYHTGNKPTPADIGAATSNHTHNYAATSHNHGLLHDNFGATIENTTTDNGWSMINSSYNGFLLKSIRSNASAPAWLQNNYAAGIAFGGADTKGVMSVAYNAPSIRFAGGNGSKPVWYFTVNGSSGKTYNMDSLAANTANTLATARTINGTSFNGSANITTANWGTARTITIGNTAKSVNGSGNVSWSLAEIGADTGVTANKLVQRDGNGDIGVRLVRSNFANQSTISGAMAFRVNNSNDNYIRFCSDTAAIRNWLGASASNHSHSYLPLSGGSLTGTLAITGVLTNNNLTNNKQLINVNAGNNIIYVGNPSTTLNLESNVNPSIKVGANVYTLYHTGNKPTPADIGAAASNHSHSYLPLSGGTLTGTITAPKFVGDGTQDGSGLLLTSKPSSGKPVVMRSSNGLFHFDNSYDCTRPNISTTVYLSVESNKRFKIWQADQSNQLIVDNGNLYFGENVFCVRGIPDSGDRPSIQYIRWSKGADNRDQIHLGIPGNGMILTCDVGFSDRRLKENITDSTENSLEQIKKIKFKAYRFKSSDTPNKERATHEVLTGVIAQEMEEINPRWVDKVKQMENSEYEYLYQINTNNVLYSSLKALQQQQAIIEQLEERISKLENALLQK